MIAKSPEVRLIYDDRAKEAKDRFSQLRDAEERGKLIGQIQLAQRMLRENVSADGDLRLIETTQLTLKLAELEARLQNH